MTERNIANIQALVYGLPEKSREIFNRLFAVSVSEGNMKPPESMYSWIEQQFGSVDAVAKQKIIRITNRITYEGSIFNPLRALRPRQFEDRLKVEARVLDRAKEDPLSRPFEATPEDPFGRIEGRYCITGSNIAKYEGLHSIIIFNDYNPLKFAKEEVIDYINTGWQWAQKAHDYDPSAKYYFFLWNSLKKAGASLAHGHAQVVLGRDSHYAKIEFLRNVTLRYKAEFSSDYFDDLYRVHLDLGLAVEKEDVRILCYLTPIKEKELLLMSSGLNDTFGRRVYESLACFRDKLYVTAFNVGIATPPFVPTNEGWEHFPVLARIVDRGYPWDGSSDFGTMELYATSIVSSDPFQVADVLTGFVEKM
jgi:hypothetical protein